MVGLQTADTGIVFDPFDYTGAANDWVPGIQHSRGPGHDGGAGAAVFINLLLAAVAGKEQREDVRHGAGLGEEDDEQFDFER